MKLKIFTFCLMLFALSSNAQTVVDAIVGSDAHNTLEAAVVAAGLAETLSGEGPFTVFAPTDDAFAALPEGTLDALLADPTGDLTQILLYHVLGASVVSSSLTDGQVAATLNGKDITVKIDDTGVFINDAQVTTADIVTDNGVVHVIDAVLLPPTQTVVDVIVGSDAHNTLEAAVVAAGLAETLSGEGPFTVFAPTDDAFAALPEGTLDALLADPTGDLTQILLYHVLGASVESSSLTDGQVAATLNGKDITVKIDDTGVFINDAQVTTADIVTDNGVVHVIDAVLLPPVDTSVPFELLTSGFELYPNPSNGLINIKVASNINKLQKVNFYNATGQLVSANTFGINLSSLLKFDSKGWAKGIYMVEITGEKWRTTEKLIIK